MQVYQQFIQNRTSITPIVVEGKETPSPVIAEKGICTGKSFA